MTKKLIAEHRQNKILNIIKNTGSVKITDLANEFSVSRETIRRDLDYLSEIGVITRSYGGAISNFEFHPVPVADKINSSINEKNQICLKALEYIDKGSVIFLDTGSTTTVLASLLKERDDLTILTNSLSAVNSLIDTKNTVYLIGGELNSKNLSFEGFHNSATLEFFKVGISFLGSNGFADHSGPTTIGMMDAQSKQTIINRSNKNIVLCDSSKSYTTAMIEYTKWRNIDFLITDKKINKNTFEEIKDLTEIVFAD